MTSLLRYVFATAALAAVGCASTARPRDASTDSDAIDPDAFVEVRVGGSTCARTAGGDVYCWGSNILGSIGADGPFENVTSNGVTVPCASRPLRVVGVSHAVQIATGGGANYAVLRDGTVMAWGTDVQGQLGDGLAAPAECAVGPSPSFACRHHAATIPGLANVVRIEAGYAIACALIADGTVSCWGSNNFGEAGVGETAAGTCASPPLAAGFTCQTTPARIPRLDRVVDLSAGWTNACAIRDDGSLWCWGSARMGELGVDGPDRCTNPSVGDVPVPCARMPVRVPGVEHVANVVVGGGIDGGSLCATTQAGDVYCWGDGSFDLLGVDESSLATCLVGSASVRCATTPTLSSALRGSVAFALDTYVGIATTTDGRARMWGAWHPDLRTVSLGSLHDVVQVAVGITTACALESDHSLYCWGLNETGSVGDGTFEPRTEPVRISH